jgi:hypothetical protein
MKKLLLCLLLWVNPIQAQTIIAYDYMETWNWPGLWYGNTPNSTWATNFSVSPNTSAVIYGAGNGSSALEQDWYVLPNITGLNPNSQYEFRFRLASYRVTSTNNTRGVDVADFVDVQVSYDGELSYTSELRITGNSNAFWDYNTNGTITHVANGSFTNSLAPVGDIYQSGAGNQQFTGPSVITLILPPGITQVAVDILCRVNSAGEEWWLDNIELIEDLALPIELVSFTGTPTKNGNIISWKTSSESNTDYYLIERSTTGEFTEKDIISIISAAGNSTELLEYNKIDKDYSQTINYYQLTQVDKDGNFKTYGPISIDNTYTNKQLVKVVNMLGQEVDQNANGVLFEIYDDGSLRKIIR